MCRRQYTQQPAISRKDNKTKICPDCGVDEALDAYFGSCSRFEGREETRREIHRIMKEAGAGNG